MAIVIQFNQSFFAWPSHASQIALWIKFVLCPLLCYSLPCSVFDHSSRSGGLRAWAFAARTRSAIRSEADRGFERGREREAVSVLNRSWKRRKEEWIVEPNWNETEKIRWEEHWATRTNKTDQDKYVLASNRSTYLIHIGTAPFTEVRCPDKNSQQLCAEHDWQDVRLNPREAIWFILSWFFTIVTK